MPVIRNLFREDQEYRECITADIGRHFEVIKKWIPDGEHKEFQERMHKCIVDGQAWCTQNTFIYYRGMDGVALFGHKYPTEMLALFMGVFSQQDMKTDRLRFTLHPGKEMKEYKTMLTIPSMQRATFKPGRHVFVRVDKIRDKMLAIQIKQFKNR